MANAESQNDNDDCACFGLPLGMGAVATRQSSQSRASAVAWHCIGLCHSNAGLCMPVQRAQHAESTAPQAAACNANCCHGCRVRGLGGCLRCLQASGCAPTFAAAPLAGDATHAAQVHACAQHLTRHVLLQSSLQSRMHVERLVGLGLRRVFLFGEFCAWGSSCAASCGPVKGQGSSQGKNCQLG